jgi:hypothetical protein
MTKRRKEKMTNNDIYKTAQMIQIKQTKPHKNPDVNSGAQEWYVVSAPLVAPVMLQQKQTSIILSSNGVIGAQSRNLYRCSNISKIRLSPDKGTTRV